MGTRGTTAQRIEESQNAARIMCCAWRGNMRFPDARLDNSLPARMTLVGELRRLRPRTIILPYWEGRHPDHYITSKLLYEACFLSGLAKLDEGESRPHRPFKVLYASLYANVTPSFVVDISAQFERKLSAIKCYASQFDGAKAAGEIFPTGQDLYSLVETQNAHYGSLIRKRYGEPFFTHETMEVDDVLKLGVRSI
jgi:bacillithiol biosynthesis deacetylase BshB1